MLRMTEGRRLLPRPSIPSLFHLFHSLRPSAPSLRGNNVFELSPWNHLLCRDVRRGSQRAGCLFSIETFGAHADRVIVSAWRNVILSHVSSELGTPRQSEGLILWLVLLRRHPAKREEPRKKATWNVILEKRIHLKLSWNAIQTSSLLMRFSRDVLVLCITHKGAALSPEQRWAEYADVLHYCGGQQPGVESSTV